MKNQVYVEQFGAFWSFTVPEFIEICRQGLEGKGHHLPKNNQLRRKPSCIVSERFERKSYYLTEDGRKRAFFFKPLDWEKDDYADAIDEMNREAGND